MKWGKHLLTALKLVLGVSAVLSVYLLEQSLNHYGCRFAVDIARTALPFLGLSFRELLNHKATGRFLNVAYLAAVGFILLWSFSGVQALENGGCEEYHSEFSGADISDSTIFMNETEYREFQSSDFLRSNTSVMPNNEPVNGNVSAAKEANNGNIVQIK